MNETELLKQYQSLIQDVDNEISLLANTSAFIYQSFNQLD
jgi:putative methionine-R-sulfoxide reductase with GAF domain